MERCPYCEIYCKTKSALKKQVYRQHRLEKKLDEEKNDWEKIKDNARAATNDNRYLTQNTLECPPPPPPTPSTLGAAHCKDISMSGTILKDDTQDNAFSLKETIIRNWVNSKIKPC